MHSHVGEVRVVGEGHGKDGSQLNVLVPATVSLHTGHGSVCSIHVGGYLTHAT